MRKFLLRIVPFEGEASTKDGRLEVLADHGYVLRTDGLRGPASITCLVCGATSFNAHDVDQRYCGKCHVFHEEDR
jgi:ribosomal protein S27AE